MTRLIFVRHGEAEGNIKRNFHGFTNSALTENGRVQVARLAKRLQNEPIDYLYSSDLTRAFETAEAIAKTKGLSVQIDERFREINGGDWENVPFDDLPKLFPKSYESWVHHPYDLQMPNGESMKEFSDRLISATEELVRRHEGKNICIATHGTAIRVLLCYFYHKTIEAINSVTWCDNASITVVVHENGGYKVITDGDNAHLKDISSFEKQDWWKKER